VCDPMWHVSSRSGVATLRTAIHLLLSSWHVFTGYVLPSVKGSPYSITESRVPELIPAVGSQPAGDVSHKPGGRLPLLSARPAVTLATLKRVLSISLLGEQRHDGCKQCA